MTTDDVDENKKSNDHQDEKNKQLPQEIMDILEYLSLNSNIIFKSQQRGEPEIQQVEKVKLAKDIYQRNPSHFLMRFGKYLKEKHLNDFARLSIANSDEEMHSMVSDYQCKIKTRRQDVKNRRYAALQELIKDGEYFSEQEMMKRSPELYQELIGQHLSKEEKKLRDGYDVKNTTFSGILMHSLEQKQISDIMENAEKQEDNSEDSNETHSTFVAPEEDAAFDDMTKEEEEVPMNCRQQWGNFDNEQIACSSSKVQKKKHTVKPKRKDAVLNLITADERELLRQEFISQMHEQFLSGQDSDFDYATVDDNTQYDDIRTLNQDREDKYFEESDYDEPGEITTNQVKQESMNKMEDDEEESEDELDVYMSHLNKHHSLQNV